MAKPGNILLISPITEGTYSCGQCKRQNVVATKTRVGLRVDFRFREDMLFCPDCAEELYYDIDAALTGSKPVT